MTDKTIFAGIRAHDFRSLDETAARECARQGRAIIPVKDPVITELPFEWYITLPCGLWWKVPREMCDHRFEERMPEALTVPLEKGMLLS